LTYFLARRVIYATFNDGFRYIFSGESPGIRSLNSLYSHTASYKFDNCFSYHQKNWLSPMAAEISPPHWSAVFLFSCTSRIHLFQKNFDLFDLKSYFVYFQGVATFIIFSLLAITSNDWSVKRLKKNWKKLQRLTYLAMFLLTWHILDKMAYHWTYLTPVGIAAITAIIVLFLCRLLIQRQSRLQKN
jgi:hypothetical protein